jgi:hypothetical protein
MPDQLVGKGVKLTGGMTMETTTHAFRKSPRLLELTQEDVTAEDGSVRLSTDDIEEVRQNTERGQAILELITRRGPSKTQSVQAAPQTVTTGTQATPNVRTRSRSTGAEPTIPIPSDTPAPVYVRLTRARVQQLREAATTNDDDQRRKRLARALAQLKWLRSLHRDLIGIQLNHLAVAFHTATVDGGAPAFQEVTENDSNSGAEGCDERQNESVVFL